MNIQEYISSGIIESYLLGLTDAAETASVKEMCLAHPEIKQAVDEFEQNLEKYALHNSVAPPDNLRNTILKSLSKLEDESEPTVKPAETPVIKIQENQKPTKKGTGFLQYLSAASVILFLISAALNYYYYNKFQSVNNDYQALLTEKNTLQANNDIFKTRLNNVQQSIAIMENPDYTVVKMTGIPGKEGNIATVYWNSATNEVFLYSNKLASIPEDKQFQLWAIVDGKPVDAGLIGTCDGVCTMKNIANAQAFAITLENKGGSASPNLAAMYVLGKV